MIASVENKIALPRDVHFPSIRSAQQRLKELVGFRGYSSIELDFSGVEVAFPDRILPLLSYVRRLQSEAISFSFLPPKAPRLRRLFENTNWAHLFDPVNWPKTDADVWNNVSVREFKTPEEQSRIVDQILDKILKATSFLEREHLRALEWALQEITDNVMQHAEDGAAGLIQLSVFPEAKEIEFVVSDSGIGIPNSLRTAFPMLTDDSAALSEAVKEGVTRGTGQGNGLFGSFQISALSGGPFSINSGHAALVLDRSRKSSVRHEDIEFVGTSVACTLSFVRPLLLERSLKIAGKGFSPSTDIVELKYEMDSDDFILFHLATEARSVGSRVAGNEIRNKISNFLRFSPDKLIVVDAENVGIMSSSFADEAFAKLAIDLGQDRYKEKIRFKNMQPINEQIITRSLNQRLLIVTRDPN